MNFSLTCVNLVKHFEGCKLIAYPDPQTGGTPWTIGYGHTLGIHPGMVIDQAQADAWLQQDIELAADIVTKWVVKPLTQNQFDALTDFAYNLGPGMVGHRDGFVWLASGIHSTLLRQLNNAEYDLAAVEIPKWIVPPLPGLIKRRLAELYLYLTP